MLVGTRSLRSLFLTAATLSLPLLAAACGSGAPKGPIDGKAALRHVEAMVKIGPRPFGSPELAKTADYIQAEVTKLGLKMERHELEHPKEKKTIRNLYTRIDGEDPANGPILMFGAHYDTKLAAGHDDSSHNFPFVGAIDGGGAPALLIELARAIKAQTPKPKANVWFYWIDAEESIDWTWKDERALLGSDAFCQMLSETKVMPRVKAFVLLDLMGSKNVKFDKDGDSSGQLIELFRKVGDRIGIGERMFKHPTEQALSYYRQKNLPWGIKDDHLNFKKYGVPAMLLIDFQERIPPHLGGQATAGNYEQWWHTPDDNLDAMDPVSLATAGNLVMEALADLDAFVNRK